MEKMLELIKYVNEAIYFKLLDVLFGTDTNQVFNWYSMN